MRLQVKMFVEVITWFNRVMFAPQAIRNTLFRPPNSLEMKIYDLAKEVLSQHDALVLSQQLDEVNIIRKLPRCSLPLKLSFPGVWSERRSLYFEPSSGKRCLFRFSFETMDGVSIHGRAYAVDGVLESLTFSEDLRREDRNVSSIEIRAV
jgi:hypothetical protein